MVRYEHDRSRRQHVAVFPDGSRVVVDRSRARAYPALPGDAPNTTEAYQLAIAHLRGRARRVADLGAGSGAGSASLHAAGFDVIAVDECDRALEFARRFAPGVRFVRGSLEACDVREFDALVLNDVLGLLVDDAATLRALAHSARPGTLLVGAVAVAEVGQTLVAPARRAFSAQALDALLVRTGWTPPVLLGRAGMLLVFASEREGSLASARALEYAERARDVRALTDAVRVLVLAARRVQKPAEAREVLLTLGTLHHACGESDLAEQAITAANAIAPGCAEPYVALAALRLAGGEIDDAEALLDHALALDPTHPRAWRDLASIFAARGEGQRAAECLECAVSLAPSDMDLVAELSRALANQGNAEGAARALERLLPYGAASVAVRRSYGWLALATQTRGTPACHQRRTTGVYPIVDLDPEGALGRVLAS